MIEPNLSALSRRAALSGLLAAAVAPPARAAGNPPRFGTARYQFTLVRPARLVPATRLVGVDGAASDLSFTRGKVVLLNFWATWCPACRTELPNLDRLQASMDRKQLQVIAVATDREGGAKGIVTLAKERGYQGKSVSAKPLKTLQRPTGNWRSL